MEHLAHVIFGLQDLDGYDFNNHDFCRTFMEDTVCPVSPCK